MIAIKASQIRNDFKNFYDRVVNGETIIVSRPNNENIVLISEDEYNAMQKAVKNAAYMNKVEQGFQDIADGKGKSFTLKELDAMAE